MKIDIYGSPDMKLSEEGYFRVSGDTLITWLGHVYGYGAIPPKNPERQDFKYLIQDYKQTEWRRGRTEVSFSFNLYSRNSKQFHPEYYKLKIILPNKVRVYTGWTRHGTSVRL